ncbi:MAG: type II secretion system F family protein [Deltaproteobacteria bacterium]|nr:type II secretion system F family protein [Deltaproteobacteria bacterium]MBW2309824.1 type II secretion system F family protein [Deltaproteobacteria bacterium]
MPIFTYVGKSKRGRVLKGEIEAADERIARIQLKRKNIEVTKLKPKPKDIFESISFMQPKITKKDLVIFTRQFSTMIDAGLPLVQGLNILSEQMENKTFKGMLKQVTKDVEGGSTLADALNKHPKVFDSLFVNLVAAGEVGGILDTILQRLSAYIEKSEKLKSKVKGALVYPIAVLIIGMLVMAVIMVFVIPVFQEMFSSLGKGLPALTQLVINMSNFTKGNIHFLIGGLIVFIWAFRRYRRTSSGKRVIDIALLKMPIFGELIKKVAVARFTRTLGTMISSGVPILDALEITGKTAGNAVVEEVIFEARTSIAEGQTIADPLSESEIFPGMVTQMISVGESTGALDAMLEKIADFYDDEVDASVSALTALMEPLMMMFLAGALGPIIIAMYLPIFQMASAMG